MYIIGVTKQDTTNLVAGHLQDAVRQNFDQRKADKAFEELEGPPEWLDNQSGKATMVDQPYWRGLLYKLADLHKSALIDFAIQVPRTHWNAVFYVDSACCCTVDRAEGAQG